MNVSGWLRIPGRRRSGNALNMREENIFQARTDGSESIPRAVRIHYVDQRATGDKLC